MKELKIPADYLTGCHPPERVIYLKAAIRRISLEEQSIIKAGKYNVNGIEQQEYNRQNDYAK